MTEMFGVDRGGRRRPPLSVVRPAACALLIGSILVPGAAHGQAAAVVRITMREFAFQPSVVRLAPGQTVRLVLANEGQIAHQFESAYLRAVPVRVGDDRLSVDAPGLGAARLNPEGAAWLEFVPRRRGRFGFACTLEGHREAGMAGTLDVR
jgi:uncharacterized cupredoxin-like copper-binding protein